MKSIRILRCVLVLAAVVAPGCDDDIARPAPVATATASPSPTATVPPPTATPAIPATVMPVDGLQAETEVLFDDHGFPHVYAPDVEAALFLQGYLTAQARFWQMDVFRRVAEGRLSEILGRATLETDVMMRTSFTTRDGRRLEDALWEFTQQVDPDLAAVLQAYSDGVNAWLADLRAGRNDAVMPPEYTDGVLISETPASLDDWRPADSLAIGRLQAWSLSESVDAEIGFARILASLPEPLVRDVFRAAPASPATILPVAAGQGAARPRRAAAAPVAWPDVEVLAAVEESLARVSALNPIGDLSRGVGSNNWLVGPELSANGHAMLANDPHLALFNPAIWHVIQLEARDPVDGKPFGANGVIFPGLPGVILGHNDVGAWGATTSGFDVTDVYVEEITTPPDYPASPRTVTFRGAQVPVLRIVEPFFLKGRVQPVNYVIEVVPHHGPMVPDPNLADAVTGLAATGMSFRWTGHEMTNDARFLFDLSRARDADEFFAALGNFGTGGQNWIWADVSGEIAYSSQVLVPRRPPGVLPYLPVSGTGDAEWLTDAEGNVAWVPAEELPRARNPEEGFLASANNDHVGNTLDNDPMNDAVYLGFSFAMGFRQERIHEMLTNSAGDRPAGAKITAADMSRFQYDHKSKEAERLLPFLFAAAANRPDLVGNRMREALDRLEAWGEARAGSPAYAALSGVDAHDLRPDIAPRALPVSEEEKRDAVATSLYVGWSTRLARLVFTDDFAGTGIGRPGGEDATKALLHILENVGRTDDAFRVHTLGTNGESTLWDDRTTTAVETRDEILLQALENGIGFLRDAFGTAEMDAWLWGLIHQVNFQHFVGQAGIPVFDLGTFAAPGARDTVNPASYSLNANSFTFSGGPSKRFVAVLDPAGIRAVNTIPGGNNGNPGRPAGGPAAAYYNEINPDIHYGDHVASWVNGEVFEYRTTRAHVEAHAEKRLLFVPR